MRTYDELSLAEKVAKIPQGKRDQIFAGYTQDDYASIDFDWNFWGRPSNWRRPGTWYNWRILAGRGFGNTRTGAEWVWCKHGAVPQLSLVNIPPVSGDCRVAAEVGRIERGPNAPEVVETTGYLEWGVRRMGRRGRLEGYAAIDRLWLERIASEPPRTTACCSDFRSFP